MTTVESDRSAGEGQASGGGRSPAPDVGEGPSEPPGQSQIVVGAGYGAWLTIITIIAVAALVLSYVALLRAGGRETIIQAGGPGGTLTELSVDGGEFFFDPAEATVAAGSPVDITLDNVGSIEHELVLLDEGTEITSEAEFDESMVLDRIEAIPAGETATKAFTLDAGTYQYICAIPGHFDAGMGGELTAS